MDNEVSLIEAQMDLKSILRKIDKSNTRMEMNKAREIKNSFTVRANEYGTRSDNSSEYKIHIFNFEDNNGFAIMSGDRRVPSLLALADSGSIEENGVIDDPGLAIFLEGLEQYYDEFMEDPIPYDPVNPVNPDIPSSYKVYGEWETTIYHGEGLCPVKWNQGAPYNTYCPIING